MKLFVPLALLFLAACSSVPVPDPTGTAQTSSGFSSQSAATSSEAPIEAVAVSSRPAVLAPARMLTLTPVDEKWQRYEDKTLGIFVLLPRYEWSEESKTRLPLTATAYGERIAIHRTASMQMRDPQPTDEPNIDYTDFTYNFWATRASTRADLERFVDRVMDGRCTLPSQPDTENGIEQYILQPGPATPADDYFSACARILRRDVKTNTTVLLRDPKLGGGWPYMFEDEGAIPSIGFL